MTLSAILSVLDSLAPLRLAAAWDNTGLLLRGTREVRRVLVTIDLSDAVVEEASAFGADLVIAYHPPIFAGLKRLVGSTPRERQLLALIRDGVHVYSPHTALDAVAGGINDWLLEAFGEHGDVAPLEPDPVEPAVGLGRSAVLARPWSLDEAVTAVKRHLALSAVRVADGGRPIRVVAVCPGAGGSVFEGRSGIDLLLTGEMRHHDVLAFAAAGTHVILTDHTNTERGYLPRYARALAAASGCEVRVSEVDADPLVVR